MVESYMLYGSLESFPFLLNEMVTVCPVNWYDESILGRDSARSTTGTSFFNVSAICRYRQHFLMLDKGLDIEIAEFFIIDEIFDDANSALDV